MTAATYNARRIADHPASTTYPSSAAAKHVRNVMRDLLSEAERLLEEREAIGRAVFGDGYAGCANLGPYVQSVAGQASLMGIIDFLRGEEGDSVTLLSDNPEGQPNNAITCNGHWTNWKDKRFEGETLSDAVSGAYLECTQVRAAIAAGKKWWSSTNDCPSCKQPFTDGDTCKAARGGCPMGGDL